MDLFDFDRVLSRTNDKYREYSNFFWIFLLLLFIPFYCAIQVGTNDAEGANKKKVKLEGTVVSIYRYSDYLEVKLRDYDNEEIYNIDIKNELLVEIGTLRKDDFIKVKGYLPSRYTEDKVVALKIKLI